MRFYLSDLVVAYLEGVFFFGTLVLMHCGEEMSFSMQNKGNEVSVTDH